jgi:predicted transcriptional regulator
MKKDIFKKRLKEVGLSKKKFAKESGVKYDTILGWTKSEKETVPSWVKSWIDNYQAKLELVELKKILSDQKDS